MGESKEGQASPVVVRVLSHRATRGILRVGPLTLACALGRSGIRAIKREGDGASPLGPARLLYGFYRRDRGPRPRTRLAMRVLRSDDGWCDAPADRNYNRLVRHPYPASAEAMWRRDHLYDVVLVTDQNLRPRVRGAGSAIFVHLARPGNLPTEGCIALSRRDMGILLHHVRRGTRLVIAP